jgi:hypothetical protein
MTELAGRLRMTPDETKYLALALDALQAVQEWPEHAPSWWRLTGAGTLAGIGKAQVANSVARFEPQSPQARWFRLSALYALTGNHDHLIQMGRLAADFPGADRQLAFALFVWWEGLSLSGDRSAFRKLFLDTGIAGLLDRIGAQLPAGAVKSREGRELRRVAILAQHLSTGAHAGTAMTFNLRAVLESAGLQTAVFSPQELSLPEMRGYSAFAQAADVPGAHPSSWQLRIPGKASVQYSDPRFSIGARWKFTLQQISGFDPDLVLFVGIWSPLVWRLREWYPVLGMSLHTLPPLAPVDVWLRADAGDDVHWPGLAQPEDFAFPFRFWPSQPREPVSRSVLDVPREATLLVTTGNRLPLELTPAWCAQMASLLDEHRQAHWLLIGVPPNDHARFTMLHPRIRALNTQADLAAWLAICDLYVNPPRVGGGASVSMAMDLGLPVVSLAGSDGGDKVGELAVATPEAFRELLQLWVGDAALRREAGGRLQARFRSRLDLSGPEAARGLLQGCELAKRCFERRQLQRVMP